MRMRRATKHGDFWIVRDPDGSYPWYAVKADREIHPINAAWLQLPPERIAELRSKEIVSDGLARFFKRKRDVLAALNGHV